VEYWFAVNEEDVREIVTFNIERDIHKYINKQGSKVPAFSLRASGFAKASFAGQDALTSRRVMLEYRIWFWGF
jgi:hypothetical protein